MSDLTPKQLEALEKDLISVAEMQRRILPDAQPAGAFQPFELFGETLPISIVGGDFYDFIDLDGRFGMEGRMGLVIADAAGHGLAAAMLIRDFNTALYTGISFQAHYEQETNPSLFSKINRRMYRSSRTNQFITCFYAELSREGQLAYINAGHDSPMLFRGSEVEALETGGPALGAFWKSPVPYEVGRTALKAGDILVCLTDGILEAVGEDGTEYGRARVEELVLANRDASSEELFKLLRDDVERFSTSAGQTDDRTIAVIRHSE